MSAVAIANVPGHWSSTTLTPLRKTSVFPVKVILGLGRLSAPSWINVSYFALTATQKFTRRRNKIRDNWPGRIRTCDSEINSFEFYH